MAYVSPEVQRANAAMAQQPSMGGWTPQGTGSLSAMRNTMQAAPPNPQMQAFNQMAQQRTNMQNQLQASLQGMTKPASSPMGGNMLTGNIPSNGMSGTPNQMGGHTPVGMGSWDKPAAPQTVPGSQPWLNNGNHSGTGVTPGPSSQTQWTSGAQYKGPQSNIPTPGSGQPSYGNFYDSILGQGKLQQMMNPTVAGNAAAGYGSREDSVKDALAQAFKQKFGADPTVGMSYDPQAGNNPAQATKRMMDYFNAAQSGAGKTINGKFYTNDQLAKYGTPAQKGAPPAPAQQTQAPQQENMIARPYQGPAGPIRQDQLGAMGGVPDVRGQFGSVGNGIGQGGNNLGAGFQPPMSGNRGFGAQFNNGTGYGGGQDEVYRGFQGGGQYGNQMNNDAFQGSGMKGQFGGGGMMGRQQFDPYQLASAMGGDNMGANMNAINQMTNFGGGGQGAGMGGQTLGGGGWQNNWSGMGSGYGAGMQQQLGGGGYVPGLANQWQDPTSGQWLAPR